jgi:predicted ABC-type ATPase
MAQKRMRVFAGPNGSGKTTIIHKLKDIISFGVYVNADDIETTIEKNGYLELKEFKISFSTEEVQNYFKKVAFSPKKLQVENIWKHFEILNNRLIINSPKSFNSYIAADIAALIREKLLIANISFSFETVMSHEGKLAFFEKAKEEGYKVYLYYIATDDPEININRVNIRVALEGHPVKPEIIKSRYYRSLENLKKAVRFTNRSYVFDNSGAFSKLIAEITDGKNVRVIDSESLPNWFIKYLFKK